MKSKARPYMLLQLCLECLRGRDAGPNHNKGFYDLGSLSIRFTNNSNLGHRGMLDDAAFDIEGTDAITSRSDNVIITAHKKEEPVGVLLHGITCEVPIAPKARGIGIPVTIEAKQR